ncbi:TIGR03619 family F420-dependent LLM class oxidoreductase [Pseudonocardia oroxyli]|uniref:Probable F420-dependent oxidoreductase, Rv2161c family n=1 Tax=Pseudonocardia oroxyli TaxID=366584 RepID=A0A1G8EL46_PSEOR|nr:TIGR03619 family F420-dependent LLM class oxidoreductase [Pseudonocardia oroxyli]SDH70571.1 probable F420-dependent oxidoreductase, Rv2161c family [Pseudonocardia oroxyli]
MGLRFTIEHPLGRPGCSPELYRREGMAAFASAAENAGFDAIAFTEHPAPSLKWLSAGGHESLDPLAALAFAAAVTKRIRLLSYLLVLPYRNPLLVAKTIATVDLLSDGRLTVGVGVGYLKTEFAALGVDFEERGALFDEGLSVLRNLWVADSFSTEGRHFTARGQVSAPGPVQRPHPPIWIGGNSRATRRRVARAGEGWMPLLISDEMAATTRTEAMSGTAALKMGIADLQALLVDAGRDPSSVAVQVKSRHSDILLHREYSWERHHQFMEELAAAGATDVVVRTPGHSLNEAVEGLEEYGQCVIARWRRS